MTRSRFGAPRSSGVSLLRHARSQMSVSVASKTQNGFYSAAVAGWIEAALRTRPRDFSGLIEQLPGVDPPFAADALRSLATSHDPLGAHAAAVLETAGRSSERWAPIRPVPHPLDYDWRFTAATVDALLERLSVAGNGRRIVYLGAPRVFAAAATQIGEAHHTLIDVNPQHQARTAVANAHVITADLLTGAVPRLRADVVIADPPWYPEYVRAFLYAAARALPPDGDLLMSLPPVGTRPGVTTEREEILEWAERAGMLVTEVSALALRYETPPFEYEAFRALGLQAPAAWRRGDLALLRRSGRIVCARPRSLPPSWHRFIIQDIPLSVALSAEDPRFDAPLIVGGETLSTVSRRDARRAGTCLWSSLNRVFRSPSSSALAVVVGAVAAGRAAVSETANQIGRALTAAEQEIVVEAEKRVHAIVADERERHGFDG
jgi:hypothetical protein